MEDAVMNRLQDADELSSDSSGRALAFSWAALMSWTMAERAEFPDVDSAPSSEKMTFQAPPPHCMVGSYCSSRAAAIWFPTESPNAKQLVRK